MSRRRNSEWVAKKGQKVLFELWTFPGKSFPLESIKRSEITWTVKTMWWRSTHESLNKPFELESNGNYFFITIKSCFLWNLRIFNFVLMKLFHQKMRKKKSIKFIQRPRQDSNLQSSGSKPDALSIMPRGHFVSLFLSGKILHLNFQQFSWAFRSFFLLLQSSTFLSIENLQSFHEWSFSSFLNVCFSQTFHDGDLWQKDSHSQIVFFSFSLFWHWKLEVFCNGKKRL